MNTRGRAWIRAIMPPILYSAYRQWRRPRPADQNGDSQIESHRRAVGGVWDEIGELQFDFMAQQGLRPDHRLLDIGCGSLRGGVRFVRYLGDGHYYGIDSQQWLLDAGKRIELARAGLADRTAHLLCRDDFDFSVFGVAFDYAIAQSVFTHLPWNSILRCLVNAQKALKPEGRFYATFFQDKTGESRISPLTHPIGGRVTYPDRDPYHYEFDVFEELARRVGLKVDYIGEWNHPRDQMMMVFARR